MNVEAGLQLSELQGVIRRRAKLVLGVVLLVSLAAYWLAMALPNEYESYATILVEPQSVAPELVQAGVPESDLNERLHIMAAQILSRPRLSRMVDELKRQMEQDIVIFENKKYLTKPLLLPEDGPIAEYRRKARRDYSGEFFDDE